MKKSYLYVFVVLLATNAIVGCNKTDMYFKHPFSIVNAKYRVAKIIGHLYFDNNYDTVVFHYDKWNKPSSIVRTTSGTGFENSYFYYDRKNRLSVIIQDAGGQPVLDSASRPLIFMNWRKYVYDQFGRIILDTNYIMGTTVIYDVETETFSPGMIIKLTRIQPIGYGCFSIGNIV